MGFFRCQSPDSSLSWFALVMATLLSVMTVQMRFAHGAEESAQAVYSGPSLSLDGYLRQVQTESRGYRGAVEQREGAKDRLSEKDLLFRPSFFANAQVVSDGKLPLIPLFTYDRAIIQNYSLGFTEATSFGMQAKLYYSLDSTSYTNPVIPQIPGLSTGSTGLAFFDARPVLEVSQSLWQNGFGSSSRAMQDALEAQSTAEQYGAEAQRQGLLLQAESAYWRLALAREAVEIQKRALGQAQATYDYVSRRAKMNLGDQADSLQGRAALEARRLELKSAEDEERSAARGFNSLRNHPPGEKPEQLMTIAWDRLETVSTTDRHATRADVKAAEAQSKAAAANSRMQAERDKPTLDVFGSLALNGRDITAGDAISNSASSGRNTVSVGLKFSIPLDLSASASARRGAARQEAAADLTYQQKLLDQDQQWVDLVEKLNNARERLKLVQGIEEIQKRKLDYERQRLRQGRTTTYVVLNFEQDYSQSELARTRAASEVLNLLAQVKLYRDSENAPSTAPQE